MTNYYNIDITVGTEKGLEKSEVEQLIDHAIETSSKDELKELVMVSKVNEVEE